MEIIFRIIYRNRCHHQLNNRLSMIVELIIMKSILLMLLRTALSTLCKISTRVILSIQNSIIYKITEESNKGPMRQNRQQDIYCKKWLYYSNKSNYNKSTNSMSLTMAPLINKKILLEEWLKLMILVQEKRWANSSQKLTILKGPFRN